MAGRKRPQTDPPLPTRKSSRVRNSAQQANLSPPSRAKSSRQTKSSRPTRSTSARGKSSIIPTPTETPPITTSGSRDASDVGSSHGGSSRDGSNTLSSGELSRKVVKIAKNANNAELMVLELMDKYSFSFPRLKELLRGKPSRPFLSH